jgi:hypothetical protein
MSLLRLLVFPGHVGSCAAVRLLDRGHVRPQLTGASARRVAIGLARACESRGADGGTLDFVG